MLDNHINNTTSVLGHWTNIKAEKGILTGEPVFDSDDDQVARIAGKVKRGAIRSCSMGITFHRDDLKYINGQLVLEKCELYEVSIVAVPSNANSIQLYNENGAQINESEIEKICLSAVPYVDFEVVPNNNPDNNMKIQLKSAALIALGFAAGTTEADASAIEEKITQLSAEKQAAELKLSAKMEAEEQANLAAITTKVEGAIAAGKITAEKKDKYIQLGIANPELLNDVIDSATPKASLAAQVAKNGPAEVKTADDFQKLTQAEQLSFKETQPDAYQKLFTKNK